MITTHYSSQANNQRWNPRNTTPERTACGKYAHPFNVYTYSLSKVYCWNCRNTKAFKNALYELEIGFDSNEIAYEKASSK